MKDLVILVATHKKYQMPQESIYLPLHVGREGKEDLGYQGDNTGDNISIKNQNYCELTGLYWAWKNLSCEYIGLCHYRRYFTNKNLIQRFLYRNKKFDLILTESEIKKLLKEYDVILPKKRNYYIETVWSHYKNAHHIKDLEETRNIIREKYPNYLEAFNRVMAGSKLHLYNMFIIKKEYFDEYCEWVFDILFELEKRIDISGYNSYQKRIFGFIAERLFNVWIEQKHLKSKQLNVVNIEKINQFKKLTNFISRKLKGMVVND
ncbi:exopolysaccharide biosynthesis protein [Parageobacillus genomosp. 1]|uniref:Exopolysaccharide biosynthesis protein n=1 Tax=Parageobacillus genomosp. 1 TaxID=1295642 RepID=A0ABC9VB22_9BACL|nr:DUF4422 domain-containing protein [Parageobacillus genomosp. 1]EZP75266.1 exopolysaccharide biosynthesis protein [Parageobacillus genomosp. 1]